MKKVDKKVFVVALILVVLLIGEFIYFKIKLNESSNLEERLDALEEKEYSLFNYTNITNENYIIPIKDNELECIRTNISDDKNILNGDDYLKTEKVEWMHNLYSGLICNQDLGWILIDGETTKVLVKEDENGDLTTQGEYFIEANGFFARRGEVSVLCCRVI